jgi:hypothetical protein
MTAAAQRQGRAQAGTQLGEPPRVLARAEHRLVVRAELRLVVRLVPTEGPIRAQATARVAWLATARAAVRLLAETRAGATPAAPTGDKAERRVFLARAASAASDPCRPAPTSALKSARVAVRRETFARLNALRANATATPSYVPKTTRASSAASESTRATPAASSVQRTTRVRSSATAATTPAAIRTFAAGTARARSSAAPRARAPARACAAATAPARLSAPAARRQSRWKTATPRAPARSAEPRAS